MNCMGDKDSFERNSELREIKTNIDAMKLPTTDKETYHAFTVCLERIELLENALANIVSFAGNPNASEGCRLIIRRAVKALRDNK